jgi:hypothetical protein
MVTLYHGTGAENRGRILRGGIRRFSWFSTNIDDARDFGELSIGVDHRDFVDIWKVEVPEPELKRISWELGAKRGTFYKLHHRPKEKLVLVETYEWDVRTMPQRRGKIL